MSVLIECHCGQIYRTDEAQAAFSIRCGNCRRLLKISDYLPKSSKTEPIFVNTELTSGSRSVKNYVVLGIGLVALAIGISLTVANLRNPREVGNSPDQNANKNEPSAFLNNSGAQSVSNSSTVTNAANANVKPSPPKPDNINSSPGPSDTDGLPDTDDGNTRAPETVRYNNGKNLIDPSATGGRGDLTISNGTSSDAIAKLVDAETNRAVRITYIQANSDIKISRIKIGRYFLKFSLGEGYAPELGKFMSGQSYSQFDEPFNFGEYRTGNRIEWDTYRVTLNKVVNGNAPSSPISEAEFDQ